MKGWFALAVISLAFTPFWIGVLFFHKTLGDGYVGLATFVEVCAIGAFSLAASELIDGYLHPEAH